MIDPGWLGLALGIFVPLPQLRKIYKSRSVSDVSIGTYALLVMAIVMYLLHALLIKDSIFIIAQAINLITNSLVLILLIKGKVKHG